MSRENSCVHCGSDCGREIILLGDKKFCCEGCKTVYRILNENRLYKYYQIGKTPGIRVDENEYNNKYSFLDRDDLKEKFFEFRNGTIVKVTFYIPAIHCASCIWLLENLSALDRGIRSSRVNFVKKEVSVVFDEAEINLRKLVELLVSVHYIPDISLQTLEKKGKTNPNKKLLYKIGVAGFVFGNVMLYSLPEYFNKGKVEGTLGDFFSILSYVLILPVVFYCGNDYLISAWKALRRKTVNIDLPIAIGILGLFLQTSCVVFTGEGQGYSDSLSGLLFFLLTGRYYQGKTYEALAFDRDYKSYFPVAVTKIYNGTEERILLNEIKTGDEILIRNKELIPADCKIINGTASIDYSFVTGESAPVRKEAGEFVYAGGRQSGSAITIKVEKEVEQSHLTKLWNQDESRDETKVTLKRILDRLSRYFTVIIILIALAGSAYWFYFGEAKTAIFVFTAVLIITCPCALAMSVPFTFGNAMRVLGNAGFYIKNSEVIEKLTHIDTVVFDKTGTITRPDQNRIEFSGFPLTNDEQIAVASLCKQSTHPLSAALVNYYENHVPAHPGHFVEISGKGIFGKVNGLEIKLGSEEFVTGKLPEKKKNSSVVFVSVNAEVKGYFTFYNKYREGFYDVIQGLKKHFELYLLSGDNDGEKENLKTFFPEENMRFNQSPRDKKTFIEQLQKQGRKVLMTGDGLNDAGALMQADVALTVAGDIYHFSPAGDAILEASKFARLEMFARFIKKAMNIVKINFVISFLYNIIGISFALTGTLSPVVGAILMPVSSVSVVTFATFATRFAGRKL